MSTIERTYRMQRHELWAPWVGEGLIILALGAAGMGCLWMLHAFAGKDTNLNVGIAVSVSLSANILMAASHLKKRQTAKAAGEEMNRLRSRIIELEAQVEERSGTVTSRHRRRR